MSVRLVVLLASVAAAACGALGVGKSESPPLIGGPYGHLLASSADLGSSRVPAQVTVRLANPADSAAVARWTAAHGLDLRWNRGDDWAVIKGPADALGAAFGVPVHDYRGPLGPVFYASPQQPAVPGALDGDLDGVGRVLGYSPHHSDAPTPPPRDVPNGTLAPATVRTTYNVAPLTAAGFTGAGETVAVFAFSGYEQSDLDEFSDRFGLPRFRPELLGSPLPAAKSSETTMDLQVVHSLAPNARLVVINARSTAEGDGTYVKIADLMNQVDSRFPGAVWSLSIGWGCDKLLTATDLAPVRSALTRAHAHGTVAFDASGDLAGMECRGGHEWSSPPGPDDVGLDAVASVPEVTNVGGTTLSITADGRWLSEAAWFSSTLTLGSAGGASSLFDRPLWQLSVSSVSRAPQRLVPDVSAVSDTATGLAMVFGGRLLAGGGTSMAAPLWAGVGAVINQFLVAHGGRRVGDFNPVLYRIAEGSGLPAFHDIVRGANAVATAGPGYDLVTGLGTPDVDNLAHDVLDLQRTLR